FAGGDEDEVGLDRDVLAVGVRVGDAGGAAVAEDLGRLRAFDDLDAPQLHHLDDVAAQVLVDVVQARRPHQRAAGQDGGLDAGGLEEGAVLHGDLRAADDHTPAGLVVEVGQERGEVVDP